MYAFITIREKWNEKYFNSLLILFLYKTFLKQYAICSLYKNDIEEVPTKTFYSTIMHSYLLIFSSFLQRPHQTVIMTVKIINECVFRQPK